MNESERERLTIGGYRSAISSDQAIIGGRQVMDSRGPTQDFNPALIEYRLGDIMDKLEEIKKQQDRQSADFKSQYVTIAVFDPIQKLVYGVVGIMLIAVVGAVVSMVLKK